MASQQLAWSPLGLEGCLGGWVEGSEKADSPLCCAS